MNEATFTLKDYAAGRDALLGRIVAYLRADRRIAAAWLEGSFGRNEADQVSDLDLHLAVENAYSEELCFHPTRRNAGAAPQRLALISTFGQPAVIHENHNNAPPGGSFSFVLYTASAVMVDWVLVPLAAAARLPQSLLLFEKTAIPVRASELSQADAQPLNDIPERIAFFWMMAAVSCKFIVRQDDDTVEWFFTVLQKTLGEVERLVHPDSHRVKKPVSGSQAEILLKFCNQMNGLAQEASNTGVEITPFPRQEINTLVNLST